MNNLLSLALYGVLAVSVTVRAELPPGLLLDSVPMADANSAPEVKLDLPLTSGPFQPTWESIWKHYPGTPAWLRDAKFGIWVHFGLQAAGMSALRWTHEADALVINAPSAMPFATALTFNIR